MITLLNRLVYLSPVPWASFAQRPHKFVEWFHGRTGGEVLWIDPYPTRFPSFSDFRRLGMQDNLENHANPPWLNVIRPSALPMEPLPASGLVNRFVWRSMLKDIEAFARRNTAILTIGKPSVLAMTVLRRLDKVTSIYDAMDDFPSFYSGLSRLAMRQREKNLVGRVTHLLTSSTALRERWSCARPDVQLVPNGLDARVLPAPKMGRLRREKNILGYVGTIGPWFDWEWVIALAKARPHDVVRLIGPIFSSPPYALPGNIEVLPPCPHQDALLAMQEFDVGLIPFKKNELTASVDPIKYYEYRALGLPVLSTAFGEMALRGDVDGTYISMGCRNTGELVHEALLYRADAEIIRHFVACNTWESRFTGTRIIG